MNRHSPEQDLESAIAVIGMGCDFPGSQTPDEFWASLCAGYEAARKIDREELIAAGVDASTLDDPDYVPVSIRLEGYDEFDCAFFGLNPREAAIMDPQHRRFLQCCWTALEHSGHTPQDVDGSIGVYGGAGMGWYLIRNVLTNRRLVEEMGEFLIRHTANDKDFLTTRVSYQMDLRGPSINVQTACSTSLVAVHLACQSLLGRECDMALAGGSTIEVPHGVGYRYKEGEVRSTDGRCRAFDADSSGTNFGSGAGVVVLRRLQDAIEDGDSIYAVIRGTAINNDGSAKVGYLAPSVEGQAAAIAEAMAVAGVEPETVGYFETHGTGTRLGDPIEIAALTEAFGNVPRSQFCAIGSLKTNIGHLDTAAGVAGLIKVTQSLRHAQLAPSLNFAKANPEIDFPSTPFFVNTTLADWERGESPRRAGVSSLGVGGTNAHAIVEEWIDEDARPDPVRAFDLMVVSGKTASAAAATAAELSTQSRDLSADPGLLADLSYTMSVGRVPFEFRTSMVVAHGQEPADAAAATAVSRASRSVRKPVFMFSGQGTQYVGMAARLYEVEPLFRRELDRCLAILETHGKADLRGLLLSGSCAGDASLQNTELAQPALFSVEYALAKLWMSWGVEPKAFIGHSVGEYVAACLGGLFALEDALALVSARGRLVAGLPHGDMIAVSLDPDEAKRFITDEVALAAVNTPESVVLAGAPEAIDAVVEKLDREGVLARRLKTSHAFHSHMLDPILDEFRTLVGSVSRQAPGRAWISNVTGTWIEPDEALSAEYWVRHLRHAVLFADGIRRLEADGYDAFIEIGPGDTLTRLAASNLGTEGGAVFINSLPPAARVSADGHPALDALGAFWSSGGEVDWARYWAGSDRRRVAAPTYPFARTRCWLEPGRRDASTEAVRGGRLPLDNWFYLPGWRPTQPRNATASADGAVVLVFGDSSERTGRLCDELAARGPAALHRIEAGAQLQRTGDDRWTIDATDESHYRALLADLPEASHVVWAWSLGDAGPAAGPMQPFDRLYAFARSLGDLDRPLRLQVLTDTAFRVLDSDVVDSRGAMQVSLGRVLAQEIPHVACSFMDVRAHSAQTVWVNAAADDLFEPARTDVMAVRGRECYRETFEPVAIEQRDGRSLIRRNGTYLVTGAFGGLGRLVAEYLARTFAANLVLMGRNAPDSDEVAAGSKFADRSNRRFVDRLGRLGAKVVSIRADVCEEQQVARTIETALETFGTIDGVFHVAGTIDDNLIALKSLASAHRVLGPKVVGTEIIDRLVAPHRPGLFVVFSSLSATAGLSGQADYAAGNAFVDSFAQSRGAEADTQYLAVDWSVWRGTGMADALSVSDALGQLKLGGFAPVAHELFSHIRESDDSTTLIAPLSADKCWYLAEHKLRNDDMVMPGAGFLEIIAAAFEGLYGRGPFVLRDVEFISPLIVPAGGDRLLAVEAKPVPDESGLEISISVLSAATAPDGDELVSCTAAALTATASVERESVSTTRNTEPPLRTAPAHSALVFGPRWRCITNRRLEAERARLDISLDPAFEGDLLASTLHPALLDVAMAGGQEIAGDNGAEAQYAPVRIAAVEVFGPLQADLRSTITRAGASSDGVSFDSEIQSIDGAPLVRVRGLMMRVLPGEWSSVPAADVAGRRHAENSILTIGLEPGISPAEGLEALSRMLARPGPSRVIVSPLELESYLAELRSATKVGDIEDQEPDDDTFTLAPRPELSVAFVEPESEQEKQIAAIWQAGLGIDSVGAEDNFFELGGHSLLLSQLIARIRKKHGMRIQIDRAFEHPTVREWAQVGSTDAAESLPEVMRVDRGEYRKDASVLAKLQ